MVQGASGRGLGPAFRGLVAHRASTASSAIAFVLVLVVSRMRRSRVFRFRLAFGVGPACGIGGFVSALF